MEVQHTGEHLLKRGSCFVRSSVSLDSALGFSSEDMLVCYCKCLALNGFLRVGAGVLCSVRGPVAAA
jgi:hypothetical protein